MAETKRQYFKRHLRIIRTWTTRRDEGMLLSSFYHLATLDQTENADLWKELRETLAGNEDLHSEWMRGQLHVAEEVEQGHWWFDPDEWVEKRQPAPA